MNNQQHQPHDGEKVINILRRQMFMRNNILLLLTLTLMITLPNVSADFPPEPEGEWYLIDHGNALSDSQETEMESKLMDVQNSTGALVRVVTIKSMEDLSVYRYDTYFDEDEGYARQMYQHYGMEGGENETILIGLSVEDRRFKFVMPGHSVFAQERSQVIFDEDVAPYLGANQWNEGLNSAIDGIEPYAADEISTLPKTIFWGLLAFAALSIPLIIQKTKKHFTEANYDDVETVVSYNRLVKESLIQRGNAAFTAMDGSEDSKAKWELLEDINTIKEFDINEVNEMLPFLMREKSIFAMVRISKRADDLNIDEDINLNIETIDRDIENINKHISIKNYVGFGAYIFSSFVLILTMLVFNLFLKSSGLGIDEIITNFETINGYYMILVPLLLTTVYTIAITLIKPYRQLFSMIVAGVFFPTFARNMMFISRNLTPMNKTTNASGAVLIPGFLGLTGVMSMGGYGVISTGRDEYGNEMYDVQRDYSNSDSGGSSCGSSCGGGGCGGGGCGGGGGF